MRRVEPRRLSTRSTTSRMIAVGNTGLGGGAADTFGADEGRAVVVVWRFGTGEPANRGRIDIAKDAEERAGGGVGEVVTGAGSGASVSGGFIFTTALPRLCRRFLALSTFAALSRSSSETGASTWPSRSTRSVLSAATTLRYRSCRTMMRTILARPSCCSSEYPLAAHQPGRLSRTEYASGLGLPSRKLAIGAGNGRPLSVILLASCLRWDIRGFSCSHLQQSFDLPSLFTQDGFFFARKLDLARVSRPPLHRQAHQRLLRLWCALWRKSSKMKSWKRTDSARRQRRAFVTADHRNAFLAR